MTTTIDIGRKPYISATLKMQSPFIWHLECKYQQDFNKRFTFTTNDADFELIDLEDKFHVMILALDEQLEAWANGIDAMLDAEDEADQAAIRETEESLYNYGRL